MGERFDSIRDFKEAFKGERIFLLGNGPSILDTPLESLSKEYTFSVNKISFLFDDTDWRPSFYLAEHDNTTISCEHFQKMIDLDIPCFFPTSHSQFLPTSDNIFYYTRKHLRNVDSVDITDHHISWGSIDGYYEFWSDDITDIVYKHATVLYIAFQIIDYMGFDEIYLLGCDLYEPQEPHMLFESGDNPAVYSFPHDSTVKNTINYASNSNTPVRSLINAVALKTTTSGLFKIIHPYLTNISSRFEDPGHFYNSSGLYGGNRQRNEMMERSHKLAKEAANEKEFKIYNATPGGYLEVHPRVNFDDLQRVV